MKKIFFGLFSLIFLFFAPFVFAENISHFHSDIVINKDATVDIIERIDYDFGELKRHGIYRDIPVKYVTDNGVRYSANIDNISVLKNKEKVPFVISREGTNKRIKIGDPDTTITGKHQYEISYTVHDAITYFDDHQEFYWNITGGEWLVGMNTVTASVSAPSINKVACFTGAYGAREECDSVGNINKKNNNSTVMFAHNVLDSYEEMSVVIGMPAGAVYQPSFVEKWIKFFVDNWIISVPIVVFLFMWYRWWRYGRDPKDTGVVVPYYEAPDGLSPAAVGMVVDEIVHDRDIAAAIISIAVKGYMHIRKDGDKYIFIKTNTHKEILSEGEQKLYDSIFDANKAEVKLDTLKNKFYTDLAKVKDAIISKMIAEGYYSKKPETVRAKYVSVAITVGFASFFIMSMIGVIYGVAVLLSSVPIVAFGWFMPKRTKKGVLMREKIMGLKLYLETAEKDRINFHNAPNKNPEQFEKLLPYAMALGVEKQWAEQFEDIYQGRPDWYEGTTNAFVATTLVSEMNSMTKSTNSIFSSRPQSSVSASGGSGFSSGGGFSGGGFGGGGGGSW